MLEELSTFIVNHVVRLAPIVVMTAKSCYRICRTAARACAALTAVTVWDEYYDENM